MRIIKKARLVEFGRKFSGTMAALMHWHEVAKEADWADIHDTRQNFGHADPVGKFTVFDVTKNYRLITIIRYDKGKIYIREILNHSDYDKGDWKNR